MNIDSMYEAGAMGMLLAAKKKRAEPWMAGMAFWLGRQHVYNLQEYWLTLGAKIFKELDKADQEELAPQLSKLEDSYVSKAGEWPEMPESVNDYLPMMKSKKGKVSEEDLSFVKERLLRRINSDAMDRFPEWSGPQIEAVHAEKLVQARAKLANDKIADAEVPYIAKDAEIDGISKTEAAERIVAKAEEAAKVRMEVDTARRAGRAAVTNAKTVEEANEAFKSIQW